MATFRREGRIKSACMVRKNVKGGIEDGTRQTLKKKENDLGRKCLLLVHKNHTQSEIVLKTGNVKRRRELYPVCSTSWPTDVASFHPRSPLKCLQ